MEKIMLLKIVKSEKYDALILNYVKADIVEKEKYKGYTEFTQWVKGQNNELFNQLHKEDFGKVIDANLTISEPNFNGECKQILKEVIVNGRKIEIK